MTKLSEHFTLEELVRSDTASARGIDNTPDADVVGRLTRSALLLEQVGAALGGRPIDIYSGYRSPALNKAVGGSSTSAHCLGYAIDLHCASAGSPFDVCNAIVKAGIAFDQLIHEFGRWTHISFDPRMRGQVLTIASVRQGYVAGIQPIRLA